MKKSLKVSRDSKITIRDITKDTYWEICQLSVTKEQKKFVDSAAESMAEANFYDTAWFQGIYADEEPVGFLMLDAHPEGTKYILWRFLIDKRFQGLGFGHKALELLIEYVKSKKGTTELLTSVVMKEGGPLKFYEKAGFKLTGDYWENEAVMKLTFQDKIEANKVLKSIPLRT